LSKNALAFYRLLFSAEDRAPGASGPIEQSRSARGKGIAMRNAPRGIYCILPPHVLESIAQNGSSQQRKLAINTLSQDHTMRSLRMARALTAAIPIASPASLGGECRVQRTIYSANEGESLPGAVVRSEGGAATQDKAADEAYDGLGATFQFYAQVLTRNSIDDHGLPLQASVHYGHRYDNAYWDGEQMVFGDGDGELFNRFTISLDVIGHELTHGVTGSEVNLHYLNQAGALNESISDVFGSLIKQNSLDQTAEAADWLIGKGLLTNQVNGVALRSMKAPGTAFDDAVLGKDPQPGHMRDYVKTMRDNGGVHINSGIPNRAFYLAAAAIGGNAWDVAGRIWYATVRDRMLRANASFKTFARRTVINAGLLYGSGSTQQKAVAAAWGEVGIKTS
jgi:Zn-dependent metalloprotease